MAPAVFRAVTLALRAVANVCPASPTCPQDDKCAYVSNGETFQISCATDFNGGDMGSTQAATLTDCIDDCANANGCVAVSYVGNSCYMKSTLNPGQANDNVVGASLASTASASSSALATSSILTSSSILVAASSSAPSSAPAPAATACSASYTCPENNGCTIAGADSRTFILACGMDVYGGDYASMDEPSLDACNQACVQNTTCVAAAFTGRNGAGTCYLKSQSNMLSSNANVDAIYLDTNVAPASSSTTAAYSSTPIPSSAAAATTVTSPTMSSSVVASTSPELVSSTSSAPVSSSAPTSSKVVVLSPSVISSTIVTATTAFTSTSKTTLVVLSSPSSSPAPSFTVVLSSTPKASTISTASVSASSIVSAVIPLVSSSKIMTSSMVKAAPTPAPTSVVNNPSFEIGSSISADSWSFTGTALSSSKSGRIQGNAHTGAYSFQAQGQSLIIPWTLNLVQTIPVVPGKAYNVQLFSKQAILGDCALQVSYNNVPLVLGTSVPLNSYTASNALVSSLMTSASGSSATLNIMAFCATGGLTSSLWIDDITVIAV